MIRKKLGKGRSRKCRFCTKEGCPRPAFVDYKDVATLKKLCTPQGKLHPEAKERLIRIAQEDRAINPELERFNAKRMGAETSEIKASHLPFISHPGEVARLIEQAASAAER